MTDALTGAPIEGAVVQVTQVSPRPSAVGERDLTDDLGRFVFIHLSAGADYQVSATSPGYLEAGFGATAENRGARRSIGLKTGEWFPRADISMLRAGSISGVVLDEQGEPEIGVFVRVLTRIDVGGSRHIAASDVTKTDDRGAYRVGGLAAGSYVVLVPSTQTFVSRANGGEPLRQLLDGYPVPPPRVDGSSMAYPATFAGGSSLAEARSVILGAGENLGGVDIHLRPVPTVRIVGHTEGPPDARPSMLRLLPQDAGDGDEAPMGTDAATTTVLADGSFIFPEVPAGDYTIVTPAPVGQYAIGEMGIFFTPELPRTITGPGGTTSGGIARAAPPGFTFSTTTVPNSAYWARTTVSARPGVGSDVVVALRSTTSVRGHFVTDVDPRIRSTPATSGAIQLESATGAPIVVRAGGGRNRAGSADQFVIGGLLPGLYLFRSASSSWLVKSVVIDGRDWTYSPLDPSTTGTSDVVLTLTNSAGTIEGTVRASSGSVAPDATVVVFPSEPEQWTNYGLNPPRIRATLTSTTGAFEIGSLPAGMYDAVAVAGGRVDVWQTPGFFERAAQASTRVAVGWGERRVVEVALVGS